MYQLLQTYKPFIDARIDELTSSTTNTSLPWANDVAIRLADTSKRGKGVRGALFLAARNLFSGTHEDEDVSLAVALEYLHTALLIHDDLLDHDDLRRGRPSLHKQYEALASEQQLNNPREFGKAMALCVGDIAIFGGFSFIAGLDYEPFVSKQLLSTITQEFLMIGFGELDDIALTYTKTQPTTERILHMYLYKTARYTFSLPLLLAAIVTQQEKTTQSRLETLGEKLGLLFQITDDMLTLSGDEATVGKTIGNDIIENKKTLYNVLLHQRVTTEDKQKLEKLFGNQNIAAEDIQTIRTLMKTYEVEKDMQLKIVELEQESRDLIKDLPSPSFFEDILKFLLTRNK